MTFGTFRRCRGLLTIMAYNVIKYMSKQDQSAINNEYAVASALNREVAAIIVLVLMADMEGHPEDYEVNELNRAYVLLVDELQRIYSRNSKLDTIKPDPIWKRFDVIKTSTWEINEYLDNPDNDAGQAHIARVDRLCILSGIDNPDYTSKQNGLVNYAQSVITKYAKMLDTLRTEQKAKSETEVHIPEYTLSYESDGSIMVNGLIRLKKAHAGSATERLLEQATKNPNTLFKPNLGQTSRNLSTILSSAGITKELRALFFPIVSNNRGIYFRPKVTRQVADEDNIDTTELDVILKTQIADTEPKNSE